MQHTDQQYMPEPEVTEEERERLRAYFSSARPTAINASAWQALRQRYRTWRRRHVPSVTVARAPQRDTHSGQ